MSPPGTIWHRSRHASDHLETAGYVDIHAHLIPGVDDGPSDLKEAIDMARAAVGSGIQTIATTPHLRSDFPNVHLEEISTRCEAFRQVLAREEIPLEVIPAAEVSLAWAIDATDEQLALASYAHRGTDLLIETPFSSIVGIERFLAVLRSKGYRVTLAHPERSPQFQRDERLLRELVDRGILLQINAGSLLSRGSGRERKRLAQTLVQDGLAHAIASDGHRGSRWRPVTVFADAVAAVGDLIGPNRALWLAQVAPRAIINGDALPEPPPIKKVSGRRWFRSLNPGDRRSAATAGGDA